jgi:hypothetical protein
MDEREAQTDEKEGVHMWGEDEGGACRRARTPQWGHARMAVGARMHGRRGVHAQGGVCTPEGGAHA